MYLPKSQYVLKSIEEVGSFNLAVKDTTNAGGKAEQVAQTLFNQNTKVIVTSFGAIFSTLGVNLDKGDFSKAIELIEVKEQNNNPTLFDSDKGSEIKNIKVPPTVDDLTKGTMKRFFHKNVSTGIVKEIDKQQYLDIVRNKTNTDKVVSIDWVVKGPAKDQTINGYFLEGVESKNKRAIEHLRRELSGAEALVPNPLEYVTEETIIAARPIPEQKIDIVIPSPGKRL
jgi:hypothetical protein